MQVHTQKKHKTETQTKKKPEQKPQTGNGYNNQHKNNNNIHQMMSHRRKLDATQRNAFVHLAGRSHLHSISVSPFPFRRSFISLFD